MSSIARIRPLLLLPLSIAIICLFAVASVPVHAQALCAGTCRDTCLPTESLQGTEGCTNGPQAQHCCVENVAAPTTPAEKAGAVTINSDAFKPLGKTATVQTIIGGVIRYALGFTGIIALAMFIYGGLLWMTAAGSEERVTHAKNILIWSSLGVIVIFSAYTLVSLVIKSLS